jgi:hypothetical protein
MASHLEPKAYPQPLKLALSQMPDTRDNRPVFRVNYWTTMSDQQRRDREHYGAPAYEKLRNIWNDEARVRFEGPDAQGVLSAVFFDVRDALQFEQDLESAYRSDQEYLYEALRYGGAGPRTVDIVWTPNQPMV